MSVDVVRDDELGAPVRLLNALGQLRREKLRNRAYSRGSRIGCNIARGINAEDTKPLLLEEPEQCPVVASDLDYERVPNTYDPTIYALLNFLKA